MPRHVDLEVMAEVEKLILAGFTPMQIKAAVHAKHGKAYRTVDDYIDRCRTLIEREGEMARPRRKAQMRATLWATFARAGANRAWSACAKLLHQLSLLDGLYAPTRVQLEQLDQAPANMGNLSEAELETLVALAGKVTAAEVEGTPRGLRLVRPPDDAPPEGSNGANGANGHGGR